MYPVFPSAGASDGRAGGGSRVEACPGRTASARDRRPEAAAADAGGAGAGAAAVPAAAEAGCPRAVAAARPQPLRRAGACETQRGREPHRADRPGADGNRWRRSSPDGRARSCRSRRSPRPSRSPAPFSSMRRDRQPRAQRRGRPEVAQDALDDEVVVGLRLRVVGDVDAGPGAARSRRGALFLLLAAGRRSARRGSARRPRPSA